MVDKENLIIPVYLNQRVVFDLVAMFEGGIAAVTQVSETQSNSKSLTGEASSVFGLNQAFASLFRIDLSGKVGGTVTSEKGQTQNEQRIHTPASLFMAFRAKLRAKSFIKDDASDVQFSPGDIVEFSAVLQRNPLLETLDSFIELANMMQALSKGELKPRGNQTSDLDKNKRQMESLLKSLKGSETVDLTTGPIKSSHRTVITLEQKYLNDPSMADLADGTFRVVGKITRVVGQKEEAISLNRKSPLGKLPPTFLADMKKSLEGPEFSGFKLRPLEWEVPGPALHVMPIAIFA